ncbi:hypothetical protein H2198_007846 [Neophaeococcomyces mojaviensis]|uniref:Uncharacterized protein n=1 Tax=Neophaeococcomyces mojaviensis TaxID=3383035 RepID=A0ACC2ZZ00_9EURO|nr:hypothetical protein H2198_007846 [Knufia sp. JES_112]
MCNTYIFYHICGHIHVQKTIKCSNAIKCQLVLAGSSKINHTRSSKRFNSEPILTTRSLAPLLTSSKRLSLSISLPTVSSTSRHPTHLSKDTCHLDDILPHITLIPDACTSCTKLAVISAWLNGDPSLRFEIVREWNRGKRAETDKSEKGFNVRADCNNILGNALENFSSPSSSSKSLINTPLSFKEGCADIVIVQDDVTAETGLQLMSPISVEHWNMDVEEKTDADLQEKVESADTRLLQGIEVATTDEAHEKSTKLMSRAKRLKARIEEILANKQYTGDDFEETY